MATKKGIVKSQRIYGDTIEFNGGYYIREDKVKKEFDKKKVLESIENLADLITSLRAKVMFE